MYLFLAVNAVTVGFIVYLTITQNIQKLRNNWSLYRCNPLYMPFAGWVDPKDGMDGNFRKCMNLYGKDLVGGMTDIFGAQMSLILDALSNILNPLKLFRELFTTIRKFILSFTNSTLQKASGPLSAFSFLLIKIQDLVRKMTASGYVSAFFGLSAISFMEGFVTLFMNIVKAFVIAMLVIAVVLAFFNFPLLAIVLFLASLLQGV
jgi:hypothetical protein